MKKMNQSINVNQVFSVPNNTQGKFFISLLKEYKSPCYSVVCKGRTINKAKCKKLGIDKWQIRSRQNYGCIPLSLAENIGVYLTTKKGGRIGAKNEEYHEELRKRHSELHQKYWKLLEYHDGGQTDRRER